VKISVTQGHIDRGNCGHERECAIALAVAEALPGSRPEVTPGAVYLTGGLPDLPTVVLLPPAAADFIVAFDRCQAVTPFEFDLPIETPAAAESAA
jgi:hypothetical protein